MRQSVLWKIARTALPPASVACIIAGPVLGAVSILWPIGAVLAVAFGLTEFFQHRDGTPARRTEQRHYLDGREQAQLVPVPWRSGPFWDEFQVLRATQTPEWYSFDGRAGDSLTITVFAPPPGPGVRVSLFYGDGDRPSLAAGTTKEKGSLMLNASATATGVYHIRVRATDSPAQLPQRYRLSIAGSHRVNGGGPPGARYESFADVPLWHPYHDAIQTVVEAGLMTGRRAEGALWFDPDQTIEEAEFIQILGSCLGNLNADVTAWLEDQTASLRGTEAATNGRMSRASALAMIVDIVDYVFPHLLAGPLESAVEPSASAATSRNDRPEITVRTGLETSRKVFSSDADLSAPALRGEVAELVDALMRLAEGTPLRRMSTSATPAPTARPADPLPGLESETELAGQFVVEAQEALDSFIEGPAAAELPPNGSASIDPDELRRRIETMRERHRERLRAKQLDEAPERAPSSASAGQEIPASSAKTRSAAEPITPQPELPNSTNGGSAGEGPR